MLDVENQQDVTSQGMGGRGRMRQINRLSRQDSVSMGVMGVVWEQRGGALNRFEAIREGVPWK